MKYGIIVTKQTKNIGDDIQSYAAKRLLPHVDYYIEREAMDLFHPEENCAVSTIMNGWFMNNKLAWPISPYINPLYVSVHFRTDDPMDINELFLTGLGKEDLLEHEPIGCRDQETQQLLDDMGVKTFFSGCLTLTLDPIEANENCQKDTVYLVNLSKHVTEYIRAQYPALKFEEIDQEADDTICESDSWQTRFANVESLLKKYSQAKAVITTRLHCAMPCLAIGTPVLLLSRDEIPEQGRFSGLKDFVHHASEEQYITGKILFDVSNPPKNPTVHKQYREALLKAVEHFIKQAELPEKQEELRLRIQRYDNEWERRAAWKNEILTFLNERAIQRWNKDHQWLDELQKSKDWLEGQQQAHLKVIEGLQKGKKWLEEQQQTHVKQIDDLQKELAIKQTEIQKNISWIEELQSGKTWLEEQQQTHVKQIHDLQNALEIKQTEIQEKVTWIEELQISKEWLEEHNQEIEQYVGVLQQKLEEADRELVMTKNEMEQRLAQMSKEIKAQQIRLAWVTAKTREQTNTIQQSRLTENRG